MVQFLIPFHEFFFFFLQKKKVRMWVRTTLKSYKTRFTIKMDFNPNIFYHHFNFAIHHKHQHNSPSPIHQINKKIKIRISKSQTIFNNFNFCKFSQKSSLHSLSSVSTASLSGLIHCLDSTSPLSSLYPPTVISSRWVRRIFWTAISSRWVKRKFHQDEFKGEIE